MENVSIALLPTAVAAGRVDADTGAPNAFRAAQVRVSAVAAQPSSTQLGGNAQGTVADDYSFELRGLFEPSFLRVNPPPGWNLKAVMLDGQEVTDVPLAFAPGSRVAGLRVVLTQSATSLSGMVRDDRGDVVLDATVVVFPADESKWSYFSRFIRTAEPDTTGTFTFTALPPSKDYRVLAVQGLEDGQAQDPEFLASVLDRARAVVAERGRDQDARPAAAPVVAPRWQSRCVSSLAAPSVRLPTPGRSCGVRRDAPRAAGRALRDDDRAAQGAAKRGPRASRRCPRRRIGGIGSVRSRSGRIIITSFVGFSDTTSSCGGRRSCGQ